MSYKCVDETSAEATTRTRFQPRNQEYRIIFTTTQDDTPRYIHVDCFLDKDSANQRTSITYQAKVISSILKTPRAAEDSPLDPSDISIFKDVTKVSMLKDQHKTQEGDKSEKNEIFESNTSSDYLEESLVEENMNETLEAISQTLKRIRYEKFNYFKGSSSQNIQTESESYIKIDDNKVNRSITDSPETSKVKSQEDKNLTIVQDLFYVPRQKPELYDTRSNSQSSLKVVTLMDSTAADRCYSNFSFRDVGMADYLSESDIGKRDGDITEVYVREGENQEKHSISSSQSKNTYEVVTDEDRTCSKLLQTGSAFERDCLKMIHESLMSHVSQTSETESSDIEPSYALEETPSMIPLISIKSLAHYQSDTDLPLMSVVSFVTEGRTPSMRVLRSMSQIEKDFEIVVIENSGIVTDQNTTREVQTDIVYEETDDNSWD